MGEEFRRLSPTVCKVLEAIWRLGIKLRPEARGATAGEIAEMLGLRESYIWRKLSEIRAMPVEYLATGTFPQGRGRPLTTFYPNHDNLITYPETALIFLELLKFPTESTFYIDRKKFTLYLIEKFGFRESLIQEKIDWGVEVAYIELRPSKIEDAQFIVALPRLDREKEWLEKVAKLYKPNTFSGRKRK